MFNKPPNLCLRKVNLCSHRGNFCSCKVGPHNIKDNSGSSSPYIHINRLKPCKDKARVKSCSSKAKILMS